MHHAPRAKLPAIDESPGTELVAAESAPIGDEVSRDTDHMRYIDTEGVPDLNWVPSPTINGMVVARNGRNDFSRQQGTNDHQQEPEQERTTSRDVMMDVPKPDSRRFRIKMDG